MFSALMFIMLSFINCQKSGSNPTGEELPPHLGGGGDSSEDAICIVAYNVYAFKMDLDNNFTLISNMMKELEADVVCMSELDSCTNRTRHQFQLKKFSELMGDWNYHFGKAMPYDGGSYGSGISMAEKPIKTFSIALPKGDGVEPRVLVVAEFKDYVVAATHVNGVPTGEDLIQAQTINAEMSRLYGNSKKPVFLGGDFNATPTSTAMAEYKKKWSIISIQGGTVVNSSKCIDYILQLNNNVKCEVVMSRVITSVNCCDITKVSDHLPVLVKISVL